MELKRSGNDFLVTAADYTLEYKAADPFYVSVRFRNDIGADLFVASGCDRDEFVDEVISLEAPEVVEDGGKITVTLRGKTTLWEKAEYVFECSDKNIRYWYTVHGEGALDDVRLFAGFQADNPKMKGKFRPLYCGPSRLAAHHRPPEYFISASRPRFDLVYTWSINSIDQRIFMYHENGRIGIGGRHEGGDWLVTPPPYMYLMGTRAQDAWVTLGLLVKPGEHGFDQYQYKGGEGWGLELNYDGYTDVRGSWTSPAVLMEMHDDVYTALESYTARIREDKLVAAKDRSDLPRWWKEPIFGGWGEQMFHSQHWHKYWHSTSYGWSGGALMHCNKVAYDRMLATLEEKGVHPTILIVDNRWFRQDNQLAVDEELWPDMKGWISKQHAAGRKVILWVSPFSYDCLRAGKEVPLVEHLVVNPKKNKDLRIDTDRFYPGVEGFERYAPKRKVGVEYTYPPDEKKKLMVADLLHPDYERRLRERIHYLLSPEGLDADGFEFDYTHFYIHERGYRRVSGDGKIAYGAQAVHRVIKIFHDAAKEAKSDALIISHTFSPYFDDVVDMLRLQDIYTDNADICEQMEHRARVARLSCPGCVIHTDQHPMPSLAAWRAYARFQEKLGNPCLYYVSGIETTHEPFAEEDFQLLRDTWAAYHKKLDEEYGAKEK